MVTQIKKELEKCKEKDPVKVRGVLQYIPEDDTKLRQAALEYFDTHHCYDDSRRLKQLASTHYLDCGWFDYSTILHDKHILGIVFGLTILIVNAMWMHVTGTRFLIRHFRPACGSVRYTPEEIDEQANCRESVWYPASGIYVTPKLLIGTQRGMAAVEYHDIRKAYISPVQRFRSAGVKHHKHRYYYTYQLIVKTKNHRRLCLSDGKSVEPAIISTIKEACGEAVWEDRR